MNTILRRLPELTDTDLHSLGEAIDFELQRREEATDEFSDSARRRHVDRLQSYRRRTGSASMPVRAVGLGRSDRVHRAA